MEKIYWFLVVINKIDRIKCAIGLHKYKFVMESHTSKSKGSKVEIESMPIFIYECERCKKLRYYTF